MSTRSARNIIKIDEAKCNGCGLCVPACAEGAIQIIDGKARLVSEKYCDGLGACLGECPLGALEIVEKEADGFDGEAVRAHLSHATSPAASQQKTGGGSSLHACPSARAIDFGEGPTAPAGKPGQGRSALRHWPVQLMLVPAGAPYFQDAEILVAADCVPFAFAGFHEELLKGKALVVGCPKLDDAEYYVQKLAEIIRSSNVKGVTVATMEVPCCSGLSRIVRTAVEAVGGKIPIRNVVVSIRGKVLPQTGSCCEC